MWKRSSLLGLALAALLLSMPVFASVNRSGSVTLGHWLANQAAPELREALTKHPRLRGETIRLVAMRDGEPTAASSALHDDVLAELKRLLLSQGGVRIAWGSGVESCAGKSDVSFLLGVAIAKQGNTHRVNLAMVDVTEGVWVSGANHTWTGRLNSTQKAALRRASVVAPDGSLHNPLPLADTAAVVDALQRKAACRWSDPGAIHTVADADEPALRSVVDGLRRLYERGTQRVASNGWQLRAVLNATAVSASELSLWLDAIDEPGRTQRLATVYVQRLASRAIPPRVTPNVVLQPEVKPPLLSEVNFFDHCRAKSSTSTCVEVDLELNDPAHLLVFSTAAGRVTHESCSTSVSRRQPGAYRFRLHIPDAAPVERGSDFGFYALAVRDSNAARTLQRTLRRAPGSCGRPDTASTKQWLGGFQELLTRYGSQVQWRAYHLVNTKDGLTVL